MPDSLRRPIATLMCFGMSAFLTPTVFAQVPIPPNDTEVRGDIDVDGPADVEPDPNERNLVDPVDVDNRAIVEPTIGLSLGSDPDNDGVYVVDVDPRSPAAMAGLKQGDVVVGIDDAKVTAVDAASKMIGLKRIGEEVTVHVLREGKTFPIRVKTTARSKTFSDVEDDVAWLGVTFSNDDQPGLIVTGVYPSGPAAAAGMREGDRLLTIDGEDAATVDEVTTELREHEPGDEVEITILRGVMKRTADIRLGSRDEYLGVVRRQPSPTEDDDLVGDIYDDVPEHSMHIEGFRRLCEQNERLERLTLRLLREVRSLKQEVAILRGAAPEPADPVSTNDIEDVLEETRQP